ncbi:tetratricopeptide repeat protein [Vampirovibrio chlorellavorus]|uniref:tetratricopeptide repeat protein n=1 Tax=Vampirovibrio chlorellavorus TaxID=758823 RepID=UPI0026ED0CAE|nr:tetratricopeptide repeat protein [Vampirovibrio chlorellavorus]
MASCTFFALFVYFPQHYAEAQWKEPWVSGNVNLMDFKSAAQFTQAQQALKTAIHNQQEAGNPIPRLLLADLFDMMGKTLAAQFFYEDTVRIIESDWLSQKVMASLSSHAYAQLALIYYKQNKPKASLQALQKVEDEHQTTENPTLLEALQDTLEHPERPEFHLALAREFKHALMLDLAQRELERATKLGGSPALALETALFQNLEMPKYPGNLTPLARYYLQAGNILSHTDNHQEAKHFYLKALQECPRFEWTYNALASTHHALGELATARQYAQTALRINPAFYYPHLLLGDIALEQERYQEAVRHFTQGRQIMSQLPEDIRLRQWINVENQLAFAYEQLMQAHKANNHYLAALNAAQQSEQDFESEYLYAQAGLKRLKVQL